MRRMTHVEGPNGIFFSPSRATCYVSNTARLLGKIIGGRAQNIHEIIAFDVGSATIISGRQWLVVSWRRLLLWYSFKKEFVARGDLFISALQPGQKQPLRRLQFRPGISPDLPRLRLPKIFLPQRCAPVV